jgi:hypothetical protein
MGELNAWIEKLFFSKVVLSGNPPYSKHFPCANLHLVFLQCEVNSQNWMHCVSLQRIEMGLEEKFPSIGPPAGQWGIQDEDD